MRVVLTAFNGLMRGEMTLPDKKFLNQIYLVMDPPTPRLITVQDENIDLPKLKKATFEFDGRLSFNDTEGLLYYKLIDVR